MDREQNGNCSSQKSSFRKFQQISNDNALVVIKENNSRLVDNPSLTGTFEALWVYLRYGPVTRSPSLLDGFVNRLQDSQSPSFLLFKLRGFELLPRWDYPPLFMPAFAGRTLTVTNRADLATA